MHADNRYIDDLIRDHATTATVHILERLAEIIGKDRRNTEKK